MLWSLVLSCLGLGLGTVQSCGCGCVGFTMSSHGMDVDGQMEHMDGVGGGEEYHLIRTEET